jgi:hypothetical protein
VREGVYLSFHTPLTLTTTPVWIRIPQNQDKALALRQEIAALITKRAIETVTNPQSPGFYSHMFVVPKPGGRWRPVIDLSVLNRCLVIPRFRMETARSLRFSIDQGDYAVSLDLSDAYLHIPMHRNTRKYLRFAIDGSVYTFRSLPFGLSTSPWVFTKVMNTVMSLIRRTTASTISNYLDDLLQKDQSTIVLKSSLQTLMQTLQELGWIVNLSKSDLEPSQQFTHLGMVFDTVLFSVRPTTKRILKLSTLAMQILETDVTTPRILHSLLGMMSSMLDLVPNSSLRYRPLQAAVAALWNQELDDWDLRIPLPTSVKTLIRPWTKEPWLHSSVPIRPPPPDVTLCTDASNTGWGAHLLPGMNFVSGHWSTEESVLHINLLEMKAVICAINHWSDRLRDLSVAVLSDNTSVCSYIRRQGGTSSLELCRLTLDLLQLIAPLRITLQARHIPGRLNVIADGFSRDTPLQTEWTLHPEVFQRVLQRFPNLEIDMFATTFNHRLPVYVSPFPDVQAFAIDGLTISWLNRDIYAFPPTAIIPKVLSKYQEEACSLLLVAPLQWSRPWITLLMQLVTEPPYALPLRPDLLIQPGTNFTHQYLDNLNLHVFRLCASTFSRKVSRRSSSVIFSELVGPTL